VTPSKASKKETQLMTPRRSVGKPIVARNVRTIIEHCAAGASLCRTYSSRGVKFTIQPPGLRVKTEHAEAAIASGALQPMYDGFFGDTTQTWSFATPIARDHAARARSDLIRRHHRERRHKAKTRS
jgi:hypothetical protein